MKNFSKLCVFAGSIFFLSPLYGQNRQAEEGVIPASRIEEYVIRFSETDNELYVQLIPNSKAAEFLLGNIPRFECPDRELEEIYYFCMEDVTYKGHKLTILYDKSGKKYKRGKGLRVFVDGVLKGKSSKIGKLSIDLGGRK
jgi:hypothetical protein